MRKEALLYERLQDNKVHCFLCSHHCKIAGSKWGICGVRRNEKGRLYTYAYGEAIASHVDPIEKKPLYHFLPGSKAYSIATLGCNFRCGFCQNWQISQASKRNGDSAGYELKPEEVVREAKKYGCKSISYTYTEPTVFFEYAYDTALIAKRENLRNTFVTNGFMTKEALDEIGSNLDGCNVDLKSFNDETYKKVCKGALGPVLESIKYMKKKGMWVEVTTLIVPGMNDSDEELKSIAAFIAGVEKEIPWHVSRFHPDYKFMETGPTSIGVLERAASIGKKEGLKYVYLGNAAREGNTYCSSCGECLIERAGYAIAKNIIKGKKCPECNTVIGGVW